MNNLHSGMRGARRRNSEVTKLKQNKAKPKPKGDKQVQKGQMNFNSARKDDDHLKINDDKKDELMQLSVRRVKKALNGLIEHGIDPKTGIMDPNMEETDPNFYFE